MSAGAERLGCEHLSVDYMPLARRDAQRAPRSDRSQAFLSIRKDGHRRNPRAGHDGRPRRLSPGDPDGARQPRAPSNKLLSEQSSRAGSSWRQRPMSTDARLQERPISKTILQRSRRTPELPPLSISYVPARSGRCTALSPYTPDSDRAQHSGSCLNERLSNVRMLLRTGSKADRATPRSTNLPLHLSYSRHVSAIILSPPESYLMAGAFV
jgi:hypothetical protein